MPVAHIDLVYAQVDFLIWLILQSTSYMSSVCSNNVGSKSPFSVTFTGGKWGTSNGIFVIPTKNYISRISSFTCLENLFWAHIVKIESYRSNLCHEQKILLKKIFWSLSKSNFEFPKFLISTKDTNAVYFQNVFCDFFWLEN